METCWTNCCNKDWSRTILWYAYFIAIDLKAVIGDNIDIHKGEM